jgi:hypothetical protein
VPSLDLGAAGAPVAVLTVALIYKASDDPVVFVGEDGIGNMVKVDVCNNGVKDGDETDKDCGGSCAVCAEGATCKVKADCEKLCLDGKCVNAQSCADLTVDEPGVYKVRIILVVQYDE